MGDSCHFHIENGKLKKNTFYLSHEIRENDDNMTQNL
jgi:hypothetical protein